MPVYPNPPPRQRHLLSQHQSHIANKSIKWLNNKCEGGICSVQRLQVAHWSERLFFLYILSSWDIDSRTPLQDKHRLSLAVTTVHRSTRFPSTLTNESGLFWVHLCGRIWCCHTSNDFWNPCFGISISIPTSFFLEYVCCYLRISYWECCHRSGS